MRVRRASLAAILIVLLTTVLLQGCEEQCAAVENRYQSSLEAEEIELEEGELDGDRPAQFGIALKSNIISDIANIVLEPTIDAALNLASTVTIQGQSVDLESRGQLLELNVEPDNACENCFRVGGDLGGTLVADIPALGVRTANLGGSLSLVAPLILTAGDEAAGALKLDLRELANVGQSSLAANIDGIDPDWASLIESPLSDLLLRELTRTLDPVTIIEFDAPTFGIPGFQVLPVQLKTNGDTDTVFAGFATNVPFFGNPDTGGVAPITDLTKDENLAFAFQPDLINQALSLLMFGGDVARDYTLAGQASETGPAHVVTNGFLVGNDARPADYTPSTDASVSDAGEADATVAMSSDAGIDGSGAQRGLPLSLGFDVFNIRKEDNVCFSFGAAAYGSLSVENDEVSVRLDDVQFTNATLQRNLVDLTTWTNAEFLTRSQTLVTQSVDSSNVRVPGAKLNLANLGVEARERAVVVRASSTASEAADTQ
ncbi:MAG: hypothetical protein ACQEVA_19560 [Myxococcota bacterium]